MGDLVWGSLEIALQDCGFTREHWWTLRITDVLDDISREKLIDFCSKHFTSYIGGEEFAVNHHYHIVFQGEKLNNRTLYDFFQIPNERELRGNTFYSQKPVKKLEESLMYSVKDGKYFSNMLPMLEEYIYSLSYEKPSSYLAAIGLEYAAFQDGTYTSRGLFDRICKLRADYDLTVNFKHIGELVNAQIIKKNPIFLNTIKISFLDDN